jgi:hypothetical protein
MSDRLKKAALPLLVAVVLFAALVSRLSSCGARQPTGDTAAPVSSQAPQASGVSETPSGPSKLFDLTDDDIRKVFKNAGFEVRAIRDAAVSTTEPGTSPAAGGKSDTAQRHTALVEFYSAVSNEAAPSLFAWVDRGSGAYDVVTGGLLTDTYELVPEDTLMVLTTGQMLQGGKQLFPEVFTSQYTADAANPFAPHYVNATAPYYMPVGKSFTIGEDRQASLAELALGYDGVAVRFSPGQENNEDIQADGGIPKTSVVCSGGYCYVTFYNTLPSPDFRAPKTGDGNSLRQFVSVSSDGTNTLLTLKLGGKAERYNVAVTTSPDNGLPCAILTFRSNESVHYPAGW